MTPVVQVDVCSFLAYLEQVDTSHLDKTVLECGAGGRYPPLALFYERGYNPHGIDISDDRIRLANAFCREHNMQLNIIEGDMRDIPFDDESFSFVYESGSMCHLTKNDILTTIREMTRVLKRGGYLSVGFMTLDCWPLDGEERSPGELWTHIGGRDVVHSYFTDDEPDQYCGELDIVWKEKKVTLYNTFVAHVSLEDWIEWYDDTWTHYSRKEWISLYDERLARYRSSSLQYIAQTPL
jgi:SAM-dependent methyltransferase